MVPAAIAVPLGATSSAARSARRSIASTAIVSATPPRGKLARSCAFSPGGPGAPAGRKPPPSHAVIGKRAARRTMAKRGASHPREACRIPPTYVIARAAEQSRAKGAPAVGRRRSHRQAAGAAAPCTPSAERRANLARRARRRRPDGRTALRTEDIGTVEDRFFTIANFALANGAVMPEATIAYETHGRLARRQRGAADPRLYEQPSPGRTQSGQRQQ